MILTKLMFGGKVSIDEDKFKNISELSKKHVANTKNTKKLKADNEDLLYQVQQMGEQIKVLSAELEKYQKHGQATVSRDVIKRESKKISELEDLKARYSKAVGFIVDMGLSDEFRKYRHNTRLRNEIE